MFNKRAVDAVVATVLIIMITVAAAAVIWAFVVPMIKDSAVSSTTETAKLSIETSGGYTTWDEVNKIARVQVKRGSDNVNLTGLDFNFVSKGVSINKNKTDVPQPNQIKVYEFDLKGELNTRPEKVTVAPITSSGVGGVVSQSDAIQNYSGGKTAIGGKCPEGEIEFGTRCAIEINTLGSAPYLLDKSGKTYFLTDNLLSVENGFVIGANDIIIDMNGYNITQEGVPSGFGVYSEGYNRTTVMGGEIYDFLLGIYLKDSNENVINNMTTSTNGIYGIYVYNGYNNLIQDIVASSNVANGIDIYSGGSNSLVNIVASSNGEYGIRFSHTSNNHLNNSFTTLNLQAGICFYEGASNNRLSNIITSSNMGNGIWAIINSNNTLTNITASSNGYRGIHLAISSNNTLTNITTRMNNKSGVYFYSSSNNILNWVVTEYNNIAIDLNEGGISLTSGSNKNIFIEGISNNNYCRGIKIDSSSDNVFNKVSSCNNNWGNFNIALSSGCSGSQNIFGSVFGNCGSWPVLNTHYTVC